MAFTLRVSGRVTDAFTRVARDGVPTLTLHLDDTETRQRVLVRIQWADGSHASQFLAGAQRARYMRQAVALDCRNPRFKKGRLECEASHQGGIQLLTNA